MLIISLFNQEKIYMTVMFQMNKTFIKKYKTISSLFYLSGMNDNFMTSPAT